MESELQRDVPGMFPYLPKQPGYHQRLKTAAPLIMRTQMLLARIGPWWSEEVELIDATPIPCGASRATVKRSALADWAGYGYCATLRPTPLRFTLDDGTVLYAFCSIGTLVFPAVLNRTARVESHCPTTGSAICLTITADGITDIEPADAAVTQPLSTRTERIQNICELERFYTNAEAAESWIEAHSDGLVVPVAEGFALATAIMAAIDQAGCTSDCA